MRKVAWTVASLVAVVLISAVLYEAFPRIKDEAPARGNHPDRVPSAQGPAGNPVRLVDLAGTYTGHHYGSRQTLELSDDGDWTLTTQHQHGRTRSRGKSKVEGGRLGFRVKNGPFASYGESGLATVAYWGDWVYLVGEMGLMQFCNAANWEGAKALRTRIHEVLLREGTIDGVVLVLPVELDRCILRHPVHGVLGRAPDGGWTANFGSADGAFVGMVVVREPPRSEDRRFTVAYVEEHSCIVQVEPHAAADPPETGQKVWCDARGAAFVR